jgi:serine/threonine-protein kinase
MTGAPLDSESPAPARQIEPGQKIGRYEVITPIAHGGMAIVYAVRLESIAGFGKLLAMKVLLPHLCADREFVDMFLDEARIASAVQHPNVVQVFELGEDEGHPYLVMELLRGKSLSATVRRIRQQHQEVPVGALLSILARAAEGLHAAHETRDELGNRLGIVHRDVSPQNVHVGYDGHVKVVDFGIAAARGRTTRTRSGHIKGKFQYLAPEQVSRDRPVDRRADVWALGVVSWELITGRRLFSSDDDATTLWNVMNKEIMPLRTIAPQVPSAISHAVAHALERDPERRLASAAELARLFDEVARGLGGGAPSELAQLMETNFGRERAVEDERLSAALRKEPLPVQVDVGPATEEISPPTPQAPRRKAWPWITAGATAVAIAGGAAIAVAVYGVGPSEVEAPVPAAEPAPARTVISVEVDPRARLVLVDGERHDERPVEISLREGASATVELVAPNGDIVRRTIDSGDDGRRLALPEAPAEDEPEVAAETERTPRVRRNPRTAPMTQTEASPMMSMTGDDIVRNVYP